MSTFTAAGNPEVERVVRSHMERIVVAVREGMEPDAILLRGSFGKGEGDVLSEDGHLKFLSDYEINVVTYSFRYRGYLNAMANRLSAELGVATSLVWMRPDYFSKLRVGPFVAGPVPITISLYETRYGSRLLYGRDLLQSAPEIDPTFISMESALQLMLNRMAEAIGYLPEPGDGTDKEWMSIHWLNKLMLACVESLLVSWGNYHYSYRERGRRFVRLAPGRIDFMEADAETLYEFAQRAIAFRLRPERQLYPATLLGTADQVLSICDRVFLYLAAQAWKLKFAQNDLLYPGQYLHGRLAETPAFSRTRALQKILDVYKHARKHQFPLTLLTPNTAGEIVYSVVPLLFRSWACCGSTLSETLRAVRNELQKVCFLPPRLPNLNDEWHQLSDEMLVLWKNFCT